MTIDNIKDKDKALNSALSLLEKKYGKGTVMRTQPHQNHNDVPAKILWLLLTACFIVSCANLSQPGPNSTYYTFEYTLSTQPPSMPSPAVLQINRFSVSPQFDTTRLVYRQDSVTFNTHEYHRWRAHPGALVASYLSRDFSRSGQFKAVLGPGSRLEASHVLEGTVEELFEWDRASKWQAVLAVNVTLVAPQEMDISKRVQFQRLYRRVEDCQRKDPQAVVEAMSRAMADISQRILTDVRSALKAHEGN